MMTFPMNKIIFLALVVLASWAQVGMADPAKVSGKYVPHTILFVPANKNIKLNWAVSPLEKTPPQWSNYRLRINDLGNPWLSNSSSESSNLWCLNKNLVMNVDQPLDDYLWLPGGEFLIASNGRLGYITFPPIKDKSIPQCEFHSVVLLPVNPVHLSPAGKNNLYVWGKNSKNGKMDIYLLGKSSSKSKRPIKFLFETDKTLTAVGGDESNLFAAIDSMIVKVGKKKITGLVNLKGERIREIVYPSGKTLFYASDNGAGCIDIKHKRFLQFIKSPGVDIAPGKDDSLFIKLDASSGILKLDGASHLDPLASLSTGKGKK